MASVNLNWKLNTDSLLIFHFRFAYKMEKNLYLILYTGSINLFYAVLFY